MKHLAISILWRRPTLEDQRYFREVLPFFPRLYLLDCNQEALGISPQWAQDTRLHYIPFREVTGTAQAWNRALALAYEEEKTWLLLLHQSDRLAANSHELIRNSMERSSPARIGLLSIPLLKGTASLVSVAAARAVSGWDQSLEQDGVSHDFNNRLQKAGYQAFESGRLFRAQMFLRSIWSLIAG